MSNRTTNQHIALAEQALNTEGVDAYFPNRPHLNHSSAVNALADYLADNPDKWTPAADDTAWVFNGDLTALDIYAR